MAILIGSTGNPSAFNPLTQPEKAEKRKNLVLNIWEKRGIISMKRIISGKTNQ